MGAARYLTLLPGTWASRSGQGEGPLRIVTTTPFVQYEWGFSHTKILNSTVSPAHPPTVHVIKSRRYVRRGGNKIRNCPKRVFVHLLAMAQGVGCSGGWGGLGGGWWNRHLFSQQSQQSIDTWSYGWALAEVKKPPMTQTTQGEILTLLIPNIDLYQIRNVKEKSWLETGAKRWGRGGGRGGGEKRAWGWVGRVWNRWTRHTFVVAIVGPCFIPTSTKSVSFSTCRLYLTSAPILTPSTLPLAQLKVKEG